jgi:hypothetical protein
MLLLSMERTTIPAEEKRQSRDWDLSTPTRRELGELPALGIR